MSPYEKIRQHIERVIAQTGMAINPVFPVKGSDGAPFVYSVGLHDKQLPELVTFGLPMELSAHIMFGVLACMKERVSDGEEIQPAIIEIEDLPPLALIELPVEIAKEYATHAFDRSEGKATFMQVVLSDPQGLFPWMPGFDEELQELQPVLGNAPVPPGVTIH